MNLCKDTNKTFNCVIEKTIQTDCSDIVNIIVYAENLDDIDIDIFGDYSSARYIVNNIETDILSHSDVSYNNELKIILSVSNSGNQGYFNTATIRVKNNTTSDDKNEYTFVVTRENDSQPCVPLFSGINEFIDLNDTPDNYINHGGKRIVVKDDETGLEFEDIEENLSEFNNDVGFITESGQTPPVHKTYATIQDLINNLSEQKINYLYRVLDVSTFDHHTDMFKGIREGEIIVELVDPDKVELGDDSGESPNPILDGYKLAYVEYKNDHIKVPDLDNIPLAEGSYMINRFTGSLETNLINIDDVTQYDISVSNSDIIIKRVRANSDSFGSANNIFIDYFYDLNGERIYKSRVQTDGRTNGITRSKWVLNTHDIPNNHKEYENFVDTHPFRFKILRTIKNSDFVKDGYLLLSNNPISFPSNIEVEINNYKIDSEIVIVSNFTSGIYRYYLSFPNGFSNKKDIIGKELLVTGYTNENDVSIQSYKYVPITSRPSSFNNVLNNDVNSDHNSDMITWFGQVWNTLSTSEPLPTVYGFTDSFNSHFNDDEKRKEIIYQNNIGITMRAVGDAVSKYEDRDFEEEFIKIAPLGSNSLIRQDATDSINEFLYDAVVITSRAETDDTGSTGTSYGFGVEFNEPTRDTDLAALGMTDFQASDNHEQSPATAIVTAKFRLLKEQTGAHWQLIREACRATASNANNYNIYRGFGQIDVVAAKTYIDNNIDTWTFSDTTELAEYYDAISPYNTEVSFEEKTDKTVIVKKDLLDYKDTVDSDILDIQNNKVSKSGDTMTGNLIVETNVGIGEVTNPDASLEIRGQVNSADGQKIHLTEDDGLGAYFKYDGLTNWAYLGGLVSGAENSIMRWDREGTFINFNTDGGERMRIDSIGRVGLGISTPTEKLDLGTSGALKVTQSNLTEVYVERTGVRMKNIYTGGGWARGLLTYQDASEDDYFKVGAFGDGQTFNYGFIGKAFNDTALRWYSDNNVLLGNNLNVSNNLTVGSTVQTNYKSEIVGGSLAVSESIGSNNLGVEIKGNRLTSIPGSQVKAYIGIGDNTIGTTGDLIIAPRTNVAASIRFITGTTPTEKVRIQGSNGHVGIGTETPSEKLEVNGNISNSPGSGANIILYESDNTRNNRLFLRANEYGGSIQGTFGSGGTRNVIINSSGGNVGIGVNVPSERLDVDGKGSFRDGLVVNSNVTTSVGISGISKTDGWAYRFVSGSGIGNYSGLYFNSLNNSQYILRDNSGAINVMLHSKGSSYINGGNLGIGTTIPDEKLHVDGKIKATDINFTGLPTSATGLSTGDVWNDGGTLKIV